MKSPFKPGDRVQVVDRPATAQERKERKFFDHFRNLRGTVQRVYEDGEVCLEVDRESLPEPIRKRQEGVEAGMRERWLNGLSEEARRRLTEEEKGFSLRYSIIVSAEDLVPLEPSSTSPHPPNPLNKGERGIRRGAFTSSDEALKGGAGAQKENSPSSRKVPRVRRLTEQDLSKAEEKALWQKRQELKKGAGGFKPPGLR